jgi:hypothetical protein
MAGKSRSQDSVPSEVSTEGEEDGTRHNQAPVQHPPKPDRARLWAWIFFLATIAVIYVFFVLPHQLPERQITITFEDPAE